MIIPRSARKGSDRLTVALASRFRTLQLPSRNRLQSQSTASMLRTAAEVYDRQHAASKDQQANNMAGRTVNPSYRNPLNQTSVNRHDQPRNGQFFARSGGAIKRTSSGSIKSFSGSFEENVGSQSAPYVVVDDSPAKKPTAPTVMFDENEFDSDIDLEVEEPTALKKTIAYPKLPSQQSKPNQFKQLFYPTLPKQQQAQQSVGVMDDILPEPVYTPVKSHTLKVPNSSATLDWSSSPVERYQPFRAQEPPRPPKVQPGDRRYIPTDRKDVSVSTRPAKKRTLPWMVDEEDEQVPIEPVRSSRLKDPETVKREASTPRQAQSKKDAMIWNTSASAVKQQQKKHREETRRSKLQQEDGEQVAGAIDTTKKRPAKFFLSDEQKHVLNLVVEKKRSVFFTGSAGTGKSVLMREIIASLRRKFIREPDRIAVTASTGLAACNVGGVTLHSFAGIGLGKEEVPELVRKIKKNQKARHRWLRTKVLVVDEVSMVDGELFDKLEAIARSIRNNARPFGGIQLVITGDFFQLPPVPDKNQVAKFAFDAATWPTSVEYTIALHHVFRQKDPVFAGMLNEMREGRLTESSIKAFRTLSRPLGAEDTLEATELFPLRTEVDKANTERLQMLQGTPQVYHAVDGGTIVDTTQRARLLQNCMAPELITLKKGAQVMLIKNVDESLVNGSTGRVLAFFTDADMERYNMSDESFGKASEDTISTPPGQGVTTARRWPLVRFTIADGTTRELLCQPETWKIELPNGEVQASRSQVPLILAWSLSIHKAQGQTLERVKVDLGKVFEKGQAYVALSRATSMAGLQVLRFDPKKVNAHERVRTFYSNLTRVELENQSKEQRGASKQGVSAKEYERNFVDGDF